jgi:hypothetical protein
MDRFWACIFAGCRETSLASDDDQHRLGHRYHPLGFAYYPDGAHEGVDEIEEASLVYLINGIQVGKASVCSTVGCIDQPCLPRAVARLAHTRKPSSRLLSSVLRRVCAPAPLPVVGEGFIRRSRGLIL